MNIIIKNGNETIKEILNNNNVEFKEHETLLDAYADETVTKLISPYIDDENLKGSWCDRKYEEYKNNITNLYKRNEECFTTMIDTIRIYDNKEELKYMKNVTNLDLQIELLKHDPDDLIIMSRDGEGNSYQPLESIERELYFEGDTYPRPEDIPEDEKHEWSEAPKRAKKCITFYPN